MPAPICVKCQVEMRCEKNEQFVNDIRVGSFRATHWAGDRFACPCCDAEIVIGFGWGMSESAHREEGRNPDDSITFAYSPDQLQKYPEQFSGVGDG